MDRFENSRYFKVMGSPIALGVGLIVLGLCLLVVVVQ